MAYANARSGYHQAHTDVSIDGKQAAFLEDDDSAVLDPAILDADIMRSPDIAQLRKGSFANNNGVLSPADSQHWEHQYANDFALDHSTSGASHVFHDEAHDFGGQYPLHVAGYGGQQHPAPFGFEHVSGQCTPTNQPDFFHGPPPSHQYNAPHYAHHRTDSARGSFSHAIPQLVAPPPPGHFVAGPPDPALGPAYQLQTPRSPHSHQEYMSLAAEEAAQRATSKRFRGNSPPRTAVDIQRSNGVRKKNGRIDIPQERNIHTIDDLIDSTRDEDTLKELKQQKRLLRNREAA